MRVVFAGAFALLCLTAVSAQRRGGGGASADGLSFRFLGPVVGNRVASIAGVPGDPSIYYAGAASGGVWKTTDGGIRWAPVSDAHAGRRDRRARGGAVGPERCLGRHRRSVGHPRQRRHRRRHLQVDRRRPDLDAHGADETGRIGRILVHPTNPDIVFACAIGRITGPQQERGVFRTTDGGQHWDRVLFVDENTGCSGSVDGREESAHAVRRDVAGRDAPVGDVERRAGQRPLRVARRRQQVDEGRSRRACRARRSARSTSPSRRPIRIGSTR